MPNPTTEALGPSDRKQDGPRWLRWRVRLQSLLDAVWGYDYFISYAQSDGNAYPAALKAALEQPVRGMGFSVFLDTQDGFRAGDDLRVMTRRRVRSSTHLVIVGRRHALSHSKWVPIEASNYIEAQNLRASGRVPILINIDGALENARAHSNDVTGLALRDDLDGWLRIDESVAGRSDGPSDQTLRKLVGSHKGVRREAIRARIFGAISLILLLLAVAAILFGCQAWFAERAAQDNLARAHLNLAESFRRDGRLNQASAYAAESLAVRPSDAARRFLLENPPATLLAAIPLVNGPASAIAVSHEGLLAIGSRDGRLTLFDLAAGTAVPTHTLRLGTSEIGKIIFSRDGNRIAATQHDGAVWLLSRNKAWAHRRVFQTDTGDEREPLVLNQLAFLADERLAIVTDGRSGHVMQIVHPDGAQDGPPLDVGLSGYGVSDMVSHPTLPRLAILYANGALSVIERKDGGSPTQRWIRHGFPVGETLAGSMSGSSVAFDPSPERALAQDKEDRFAIGLNDASVWLLDAKGDMLKRLAFPAPAENSPRDTVSDVRFSPQGDRLLALRDDGTVGIYQRKKEWRLERLLDGHDSPTSGVLMACCAGHGLAVTASSGAAGGDVVKVWDLAATEQRWTLPIAGQYGPENTNISALAFDATGRRLAVGTSEGQVAVFDTTTHEVLAAAPGHYSDQKVTALSFGTGAHADTLFASAWGRPLQRWALNTCHQQALIARENPDLSLYAIAWDSAGMRLIVAPYLDQEGSRIAFADPDSGRRADSRSAVIEERIDKVITLGRGAAIIGAAQGKRHLHLWKPPGEALTTLSIDQTSGVNALAATPDGQTVLAATNEHFLRGHLDDKGILRMNTLPCPSGDGSSCGGWQLAFDPHGRWFAATSQQQIFIRRLADGALLARLTAHHGQIDVLAAAPSGDTLASGGMDGRVIIWKLRALLDDPDAVRKAVQAQAGVLPGASGPTNARPGAVGAKAAPLRLGITRPDQADFSFNWDAYTQGQPAAARCR